MSVLPVTTCATWYNC